MSKLATCLLSLAFIAVLAPGVMAGDAAPIVVLKLDDITPNGAPKGAAMSPRWQRVADFIEQQKLKASFGIIGCSLEQDNQLYFDWIKNLHARGAIEFWNHGYRNRTKDDKAGEFESESADEQKTALARTEKLAKEKLGLALKAFGPHWSGTNESTEKALEEIPEIKAWFYGPKNAKFSKKFMFDRPVNLENPTFVPDFDKFAASYEKAGASCRVLALQGHPNAWDDARWAGFVKIVEFLKAKGCVFMKVSEYVEQARQGTK